MTTQHEWDEAEIRRQVDRIVEAIGGKDLESLQRLYSSDVVSFDVEPPLQHVGLEAKTTNWAKVFTVFREVTYEVRDLTVTAGEDVAFAHCFARLSGTLATGPVTSGVWVRGTLCFRKLGGVWLITHDQASVPVDVQTGRVASDLEP